MKQIHILQKRSIRLIDNSKATSHSDPLFLKYKILKINDLVDFNQAIFMYKLDILKMCSIQYLPS